MREKQFYRRAVVVRAMRLPAFYRITIWFVIGLSTVLSALAIWGEYE